MSKNFNNGVWPVMLTPFTDDNRVDYDSLEKLINWYIENGVAGLLQTASPVRCSFYRWKSV